MQSKAGEIHEGTVTGITGFGAFIKLDNGDAGMVHISEVAPVFVKDINQFLTEGQSVKVKVISIGENNKISLSIKQAQPREENAPSRMNKSAVRSFNTEKPGFKTRSQQPANNNHGPMSFEDMMAKFKADSEEKMSDLKKNTDKGRVTRRGNKS